MRETRRQEEKKKSVGVFAVSLILFFVLTSANCGANEGILKSGKETPAQANGQSDKTPFAKDLEYMRTAGFTFIYVLRRKDGGLLDAEDRNIIKVNTADANRRVSADDGKAFIIGSNFQIPANNVGALFDHFAVEDYSQPPPANTNSNANANK